MILARQDTYNHMADGLLTQDLELPISLPFIGPNELNHHHHPRPHHHNNNNNNHHPPPPPPNNESEKASPPFPATNGNASRPDERNSATPVVSLLSIEQQQEKDYLSMRGGRRRKSGPPAVPANARNVHLSNGFEAFARGFHPPPAYNFFPGGTTFMGNGLEFRRTNGFDGRPNRPRPRYDKRSNEHSSRSSLRTDSNSSASCVDENRNEERARTGVNTPPPAPYSPHFKILHNTGTREFHNATRYYKPPYHHHINNNNNNEKVKPTVTTDPPTKNSSSSPPGTPSPRPISPQSALSQVHVTTSQSFAPQARRSRRSIRRNGQAGVSEIGAGDAPLPNDDVCKKFDALKL